MSAQTTTTYLSATRSIEPVLKETASNWLQDNAMRLSAALSLYTILSLAPLLVITVKVVGVIWKGKDFAREQMMAQMSNLMGSQAAQAIAPMLDSTGRHGNGVLATVISTAVLLFSATGVFAELQDSMNTIWGVKPKPNRGIWDFLHNRLVSLAMVFGIAFLLLVSMFVSTILTSAARYIAGDTRPFAFLLDVLLSFGITCLLFAAIFKFLPDVRLPWRLVWAGAALTAGLFTAGKYGLAIYFKYAAPTSAFGAAGSLAAVLLWVYYSSFILFFGAEFTKVWAAHKGTPALPAENAVKITEEDRARQGIPSETRMANAIADVPASSSLSSQPREATRNEPAHPRDLHPAFAIAVIGAFVGGWSLRHLMSLKRETKG